MAKFKKSLITLIAIAVVAILLFSLQSSLRAQKNYVRIGGQQVSVKIAQTTEEQRQGLSDTAELKQGTGMLFLYDH